MKLIAVYHRILIFSERLFEAIMCGPIGGCVGVRVGAGKNMDPLASISLGPSSGPRELTDQHFLLYVLEDSAGPAGPPRSPRVEGKTLSGHTWQ